MSVGSAPVSAARIVGISISITVVATLPAFLIGAMSIRLREDLGISLFSVGLAIAINRASGAVMAGGLGRLTDRVGPTVAMRASAAVAAGCTLGIVALASHWALVCVVVALGGAAAPLAQASANISLSKGVSDGRQGVAFGLKQSALPVSSLIAGMAVPVISLTIGWRWSFVLAAVLAIGVGLAVPTFGHPGPRHSIPGPPGTSDHRDTRRPLLILAAGLLLAAASSSALSAFTVETAVGAGFTEAWGGVMLTLGSLLAISVRLGMGVIADRTTSGHLGLVALMVGLAAAGYSILAMGTAWSFIVGGSLAFALGWGFAGLFWYVIARVGSVSPGRATGLVLPGGMMGAMVGPVLFGTIAEQYGHGTGWLAMAALSLCGAILIVWGGTVASARGLATSVGFEGRARFGLVGGRREER